MWAMIQQFVEAKRGRRPPAMTVTAGTFLELLMVLPTPSRRSFKVVWLRTIWVDQKAHRIPRFLRGPVRILEAMILRRADLLIANGDDIAERYGRYGLDVKVIKNAVDLAMWRSTPPSFHDCIRVGYIGRLTRDKGIAEFVDLAERIAQGSDADLFRFDVYGHQGEELLVSEASRRGSLRWHGAISHEELPSVVSKLDVCVALTFADELRGGGGTSNAMMEQLAAGRLILAWDNVIFRQWLDDTNAYLVTQGDVAALAEALRSMAADRMEARQRASRGSVLVVGYSVEAMLDRFVGALDTAISVRKPTRN